MPQLLGAKLRHLRRQQALTQEALAERIAIAGQSHLANLEAGRDVPSLGLVVQLATLFEVPTDYLLRDTISVETVIPGRDQYRPQETASLESFGGRLRQLRLERNLSQTDLAQQLGLAGQGYISNLEAGRKLPSLDLVVQIADLFGVTTDALLRGEQAI